MINDTDDFMGRPFSELLHEQGLTDNRADELGKAVDTGTWQGLCDESLFYAVSKCDYKNLLWLEKYYYGFLLIADSYAVRKRMQSPLETLFDYKLKRHNKERVLRRYNKEGV